MPLFQYECPSCGHQEELLVRSYDALLLCPECQAQSKTSLMSKLPPAVSFKIKGYRAANSYGNKFIDTPGKSPVTGEESGCSFTSNRGGTVDHNLGQGQDLGGE